MGRVDSRGLRVRGWVALDSKAPWPYDVTNPPAVTIEERRAERVADTSATVDKAPKGDGERARQFRRGMLGGYHYLETVEPIKQLKREGRFEEALGLCYRAITAAERDKDGREPAPWYTEQAAIIHKKLGQRDEEAAVLERWLKHGPPHRRPGSRIQESLDKLRD